jgi:hypothetical protein
MSKAIVTVPVADGYTSQRFFEFDLSGDLDLRVADHAVLVLGPDEVPVQVFARGQWSRIEFIRDEHDD